MSDRDKGLLETDEGLGSLKLRGYLHDNFVTKIKKGLGDLF